MCTVFGSSKTQFSKPLAKGQLSRIDNDCGTMVGNGSNTLLRNGSGTVLSRQQHYLSQQGT